ncbi:unnamed protein product [Victoria cruziana]
MKALGGEGGERRTKKKGKRTSELRCEGGRREAKGEKREERSKINGEEEERLVRSVGVSCRYGEKRRLS